MENNNLSYNEALGELEEILRSIEQDGFSRIPVYEEDIDHVVGVLYVKDLLPYVGQALPASLSLRQLMRSMSCAKALTSSL
jgi:putative hemolysin